MKIDLIKVPLYYGCDRPGVEQGPQILEDNGIADLFAQAGNDVRDTGYVDVPQVGEEAKYESHPKMKFLSQVLEANTNLADASLKSLKEGRLPFVVGGDHSIGLGSLAATSQANGKDIAVIWIDAHADINTAETSPSGNIHGMPLGASFGEGEGELTDFYRPGEKVDPQNCFILGARSVDDGEVEIIDRRGLNVWYQEEIRDKGMGVVILELKELLERRQIKDIHISFDIDSLDSSLVPGTGTPVANGMQYDEAKDLISALIGTGLVRSIDFVEFNPVRDDVNQITLKSSLEMLKAFAQALAKQA